MARPVFASCTCFTRGRDSSLKQGLYRFTARYYYFWSNFLCAYNPMKMHDSLKMEKADHAWVRNAVIQALISAGNNTLVRKPTRSANRRISL